MEKEIGKVTHFFDKISVAIIEITDVLVVGDEIHIKGKETDFTQKVSSMQIEREPIDKAKAGDAIGLKVEELVREKDVVFKIEE